MTRNDSTMQGILSWLLMLVMATAPLLAVNPVFASDCDHASHDSTATPCNNHTVLHQAATVSVKHDCCCDDKTIDKNCTGNCTFAHSIPAVPVNSLAVFPELFVQTYDLHIGHGLIGLKPLPLLHPPRYFA
ncbi:hypothetical protein [Thiogranum longum]|uniref:hypothetical protein n=1 Tax=Thiogranum longum TaxID=1537524 RepID=UPI00104C594F|nr:hypothetical protein [Thiogranum longum]